MKLFLIRHGHAVANAASDPERPLSEQGRSEVATVITAMKSELGPLEAIWASPYLRAQQTLEIVTECLGFPGLNRICAVQKLGSSDPLNSCIPSLGHTPSYEDTPFYKETIEIIPEGSTRKIIEKLSQTSLESLLLVTHQPFVGDLLNELVGAQSDRYSMGTACLAAIHFPPHVPIARGLGDLLWLQSPTGRLF